METKTSTGVFKIWTSPHSLGKLIEWKLCGVCWSKVGITCVSPLVGETNWMETGLSVERLDFVFPPSPHSLGKLIEWKQQIRAFYQFHTKLSPHSLGKLIEWKLENPQVFRVTNNARSPLVGETNWMETCPAQVSSFRIDKSPLVGETNWMETAAKFMRRK